MEIMQTKAINTFHPPETNEIVVKKLMVKRENLMYLWTARIKNK